MAKTKHTKEGHPVSLFPRASYRLGVLVVYSRSAPLPLTAVRKVRRSGAPHSFMPCSLQLFLAGPAIYFNRLRQIPAGGRLLWGEVLFVLHFPYPFLNTRVSTAQRLMATATRPGTLQRLMAAPPFRSLVATVHDICIRPKDEGKPILCPRGFFRTGPVEGMCSRAGFSPLSKPPFSGSVIFLTVLLKK